MTKPQNSKLQFSTKKLESHILVACTIAVREFRDSRDRGAVPAADNGGAAVHRGSGQEDEVEAVREEAADVLPVAAPEVTLV